MDTVYPELGHDPQPASGLLRWTNGCIFIETVKYNQWKFQQNSAKFVTLPITLFAETLHGLLPATCAQSLCYYYMDKHKDKLDVVLAEYKVLRDELIDLSRLHVQIYALYLSALAVFYGSMFTHKIYDIILIIPILSLTLLFRLIWDQLIITKISHYIKYEIEGQKIPMLIDKIDNSKEGEGWCGTIPGWAQPDERLGSGKERGDI